MITIYLIIGLVIIAISIIGFKQTSKDKRQLRALKEQDDTLVIKNVSFKQQTILQKDKSETIINEIKRKAEVIIGRNFIVLSEPIVVLFNEKVNFNNIKKITWNIPISDCGMTGTDIWISCFLPHEDQGTYTKYIFENILSKENQDIIIERLKIEKQ